LTANSFFVIIFECPYEGRCFYYTLNPKEMDKNNLIRITKNLYRLTLLFPKKESLRYKTRDVANNILALGILIFEHKPNNIKKIVSEAKQQVEILDSHLEIAKSQNWVSPHDVLTIQEEYRVMRAKLGAFKFDIKAPEIKEIEQIKEEPKDPSEESKLIQKINVRKDDGKKERSKKIIDILKEIGKVQVGDIKDLFPNVSKRTLRRDFEYLVKSGTIQRLGENNNTFYQLSRT